MPALSVVLPCYNEAGNVQQILDRYRPLANKVPMELILVNNGSTDGTARLLRAAIEAEPNPFVRVVHVERNIGYGHGLQQGLKAAEAPVLAFSHADLQCSPEDLISAYDLYNRCSSEGACLVKGKRRDGRAALDRFVTRGYNALSSLVLGQQLDVNAEPKLFPRALLADVLAGPLDFTFDLHVLAVARRAGYRFVEFEVDYKPRTWGRSKLAAHPWMRIVTACKALRFLWYLWRHPK